MKADVILITGASGFVGRYLRVACKARYPEAVLALLEHPHARLCSPGRTMEKEGREIRLQADLTCEEVGRALDALVVEAGPPDMVFHLAGQAAVGHSFEAPAMTYEVNVVGTARLLEALTDHTTQARVLIPSSAQVYAPPPARVRSEEGPVLLDETAAIGPTTHYGVSKFAQEEVGRVFGLTTGLAVLVTRAFNHIGPEQGTGFVVPDFARQIALLEKQAHTKVGSEAILKVGNLEARRDYLDVRDVVAAYLVVMEKGEPGTVYNVASGHTWSARELLEILLADARVSVQIQPDPALLRPVDVPELAGDASRIRALGWHPEHDIRLTLRETLQYWRRAVGARVTREEQTPAKTPTSTEEHGRPS